MAKKSKFVKSMLDAFWESHGIDENGSLKVLSESGRKRADDILSQIVLEKSVGMYDTMESAEDTLSGLADEISFQELNADGSSLTTDRALSSQDQGDESETSAAPAGGPSLDLPEDIEAFDLNSIFEDDEEEDEDEDEGEEEEVTEADFAPGQDDEFHGQDEDEFQDLDGGMGDNEDDEFSMDGDLGQDGGDLGDEQVNGDADQIDLDNQGGDFDFDFDLPGEELPGAHGDEGDEDDLEADDLSDDHKGVVEGKSRKVSSKKMGIVPANRKASSAKLAK